MNLFKAIVSGILLLISISATSQSSQIGKSYQSIKSHLEYIDKDNLKTFMDTKYQDGEVEYLYIFYTDQDNFKCGFISTFKEKYYIKNDKCVSVGIEFANMSYGKVKEIYSKCYADTKLGKYYFSSDYTSYSLITKDILDDPIVTIKKTKLSSLPSSIRTKVSVKLKETEEKAAKDKAAQAAKDKEKKEITSKIYNLKDIDLEAYNSFMTELKNNFIEGMKDNNSFPSWSEIKSKHNNTYEYKSTYSAHYKRISEGSGYYFKDDNTFTLLSGENKSCELIKGFSPRLNSAKHKGFDVMTEVIIDKFPVSYTKAVTTITIKKGAITFLKNEPNEMIKEKLQEKLLKLAKGKYEVGYQFIEVDGEELFISEEQKIASSGSKLLKAAGGYAGF